MSYKQRIIELFPTSPGILERVDLLNDQLCYLNDHGLKNIVTKFLSTRYLYTARPDFFELFIARWIFSLKNVREVEYEPKEYERPPDFKFKIEDKIFYVSVKTILQIHNEQFKNKIVKRINNIIESKTNNVFELWLSYDIDSKDLNNIIDSLISSALTLKVGEEKSITISDKIVAKIKAIFLGDKGYIGVEHIGGTSNSLIGEIDVGKIEYQIRDKIKKANKDLPPSDNNSFNFVALTFDSNVLVFDHIIQDSLYGTEQIVRHWKKDGKEIYIQSLAGNGIWSKKVFTNTDIIFVFLSGTDFLGSSFSPYIYDNPHNAPRLRTIPEPFYSMECHIPPLFYKPEEIL